MSSVPASSFQPGQPAPAAPSTGQETGVWLLRAAKGLVLFIYAVVLIDLVMLTLGFFLRLLGASTEADFTRWVYRGVDRIMQPFRGIFPTVESGQSVFDASLLFAMIVYAVAALALHGLIAWLTDKVIAARRRQALAASPSFATDPVGHGRPMAAPVPAPYQSAPGGAPNT
jgi:uncharacterized protein YggT (Ycf19 family)